MRLLIGRDDVAFDILSGGPWTGGQALVADRYASDRLLLTGDAAHLYTPLGGLGMNTGIGDAINLAWKLAAVHEGWAGPHLLASYAAERRPIGLRNAQLGLKYARIHSAWVLPDDIEAEGAEADAHRRAFGAAAIAQDRDQFISAGAVLGDRYDGSPIVASEATPAPPDSLEHYHASDRSGGRLPHVASADGGALLDVVGPGLTLFAFGDADTGGLVDAGAQCGVPLTVSRLPAPPAGSGIDHALLLVRPDGYVAWRGGVAPADPVALLDRVRGA